MPKVDDAAEIRALAYQIWEQEGCPSGREHEHWAQANKIYAALHPAEPRNRGVNAVDSEAYAPALSEVERLRQALWTPEPFSGELFTNEVRDDRARMMPRRRRTFGDAFRPHEAVIAASRLSGSGRV